MDQPKRNRLSRYGILTAALLLCYASAGASSLTLPMAVEETLKNNPDLKSAEETVSLAQSQVEKAKAELGYK